MIYFVLSGLFIAFSFLLPETLESVVFSWLFCLFYVWGLRNTKRILLGSFICGVVSHLLAFYWLPYTVQYFGGFPRLVSYLIFAIFCAYSGLQFVLASFFAKKLERLNYINSSLALAIAWMFFEALMPKLFPWAASHGQLSFAAFSSLAEFLTVTGLSGLMFYLSSELLSVSYRKKIVAVFMFTLLLLLGSLRNEDIKKQIAEAPKLKVALVQGNIEATEKNDPEKLKKNLEKHYILSKRAISMGAELVVWPEAVFMAWTPAVKFNLKGTSYDPVSDLDVPLIYGALSFKRNKDRSEKGFDAYNTAFGRAPDGQITGFYHKKILMPFGEYMPLAETFPSLKKLSPQTGDFTAGEIVKPIELEVAGKKIKAGMLICYEDLIPDLSREVRSAGANLLVNLTNDAWYGDSAALRQHHLIASWRAIENRRTLLRATNTGYTGAVSALGQTIDGLRTAEDAVLVVEVPLLGE